MDELRRLEKHHTIAVTKSALRALERDDTRDGLIVGTLNVRSLPKNADDIAHDEVLCTADVLCL